MSFKEVTSDVALGNLALAMVSETKSISSLDDPGLQAQAVKRWYKPIIAKLLETHHWGLATKRANLVGVVNTRANEWLYAYDAPNDMAFPVGFTTDAGTSSVSYYRGLSGLIAMVYGRPLFQYANGVLYTNMTGELEYVSYDITEADFNATFADIAVCMLASRLALELPKDFDLAQELEKKATNAINIAITQNLNTGNRQYGMTVSESELARGTQFGDNWDYFPRGPGQ